MKVRPVDWRGWLALFLTLATSAAAAVSIALSLQSSAPYLGSTLGDIANVLAVLAPCPIALLIIWRYPRLNVGWLVMAFGCGLVFWYLFQRLALTWMVDLHRDPPAIFFLLAAAANVPSLAAAFSIGFVYPTGRLLSARWGIAMWFAVAMVTIALAGYALRPGPLDEPFARYDNPLGLGPAELAPVFNGMVGLLGVSALLQLVAIVVRMRRATGVEQQQLRWFAFSAALVLVVEAAGNAMRVAFGMEAALAALAPFYALAYAAVPVAMGIAIFRYRLYDIDIIIERSLVYGTLTAVLAGLYAATVNLIQRVFVATTGNTSDLSIVLTLFVLSAVFTPARTRIQTVVDRRFKTATAARTSDIAPVLEDLAGLRDRGLITAADYESKKRELLARL